MPLEGAGPAQLPQPLCTSDGLPASLRDQPSSLPTASAPICFHNPRLEITYNPQIKQLNADQKALAIT